MIAVYTILIILINSLVIRYKIIFLQFYGFYENIRPCKVRFHILKVLIQCFARIICVKKENNIVCPKLRNQNMKQNSNFFALSNIKFLCRADFISWFTQILFSILLSQILWLKIGGNKLFWYFSWNAGNIWNFFLL